MKAGNISWGIQRYHMDCAPLQYVRELTQNGIESFKGMDEIQKKTVEWGIDPIWNVKNGSNKLCVTDNGVGMTGRDVSDYINTMWASGKVLGAGVIEHSITIGAVSFSETARVKIKNAGGTVMLIEKLVETNPDGKGVKIFVG